MTERPGAERSTDGSAEQRDAAWRRRRRLAEVFGDVLPESTGDDRDDAAAPAPRGGGEDPGEAWLRENVPPHHGG